MSEVSPDGAGQARPGAGDASRTRRGALELLDVAGRHDCAELGMHSEFLSVVVNVHPTMN
ncbi:MAG: hypothetical protein WAL63_20345 [Solirubrobacteraceae bacterium]